MLKVSMGSKAVEVGRGEWGDNTVTIQALRKRLKITKYSKNRILKITEFK
jgi:hypothetical protein